MSCEEPCRSLFADLGKPTLRGIRKCPKCGTYNGSRGISCKNKYCDAVFKESGDRKKLSIEACKLITGSSVQIFSVRVRDKGPDYRGFVQLPQLKVSSSETLNNSNCTTALCFIENCEKSFRNTVLKCHEKDDLEISTCQHIQAALKCCTNAQPLIIKNSVISLFNISNNLKQEIWSLVTESSGPLVQRVSKNIMAVKCKVSPKHPLGYLNFSFFTTKLKDNVEHNYFCNCSPPKETFKSINCKNNFSNNNKCIHFYACICAFASDPKLSEEFQYYINIIQKDSTLQNTIDLILDVDDDKLVEMDLDNLTVDDTHFVIFQDDSLAVQNFQSDKLDNIINASIMSENIDNNAKKNNFVLDDISMISEISNLEIINQNAVFEGSTIKIIENPILVCDENMESSLPDNSDLSNKSLKSFNESNCTKVCKQNFANSTSFGSSNTVLKSDKTHKSGVKRKLDRLYFSTDSSSTNSVESKKLKNQQNINQKCTNNIDIDENNTHLSFIKWLSSITERINQTMHFQFSGKPDPLVFHAPHLFFECLRDRISGGSKKKRLPNSTTAFVRKDGVPLGTFTKYTWQITNILHVKSIFETPFIPLEITKSFIQKQDGTYELYVREETNIDKFKKTNTNALIKPLELKTYLKVGNTSPNQLHPTPFLIEWIPDILPISKIGELRICFEFGHIRNESQKNHLNISIFKNKK